MGLGLTTMKTGKDGYTPPVLNIRALTVAELKAHQAREGEFKTPALERLQGQHKRIARAIASGAKTGEVAAEFGISPSRVSILKNDPSFLELVRYFETREDEADRVIEKSMANVLVTGLDILQGRLEDDPDAIETDTLLKIIEKTADRSGFAPKRVEEKNITVNFGDRLEEARRRAHQSAPQIIEGEIINE